LKIYVSHSSVATQLKCGGIFNNHFVANCPQYVPVENVENQLIFGEDMKKTSGTFFWNTLYIYISNKLCQT